MAPSSQQDLYRIGTVASLTGLSVERLRAWERRYDLSPAHKSGRTRFYSKAQLERLKLIKHLIDQGQPISTLATLSTQQLEERLASSEAAPAVVATQRPQVGLVGPNLLTLEAQAAAGGTETRLDVVARWANVDALREEPATDTPQVLVLQVPVPRLDLVETARDTAPDADLIVVYQFGTAEQLAALEGQHIPTLKWPVSWTEVEHVAIAEYGYNSRPRPATARRYSDEELIAIAASVEDGTNSPQYLIEAIHQLNALTEYTAETAAVAQAPAPYRQLASDAALARTQLEQALETLLDSLSR